MSKDCDESGDSKLHQCEHECFLYYPPDQLEICRQGALPLMLQPTATLGKSKCTIGVGNGLMVDSFVIVKVGNVFIVGNYDHLDKNNPTSNTA